MKHILGTLDAKMGSPLYWKTSILGEYLSVKIHFAIGFIDYTPSLLKLVLFCCLCDRTKIRSERTPIVPKAACGLLSLTALVVLVFNHLVTLPVIDNSCFGGRFGDYIHRVDIRLVMLSRLAMCRFGLAVVISHIWILVFFIRVQTRFAVVWAKCEPVDVLHWCLSHGIL